MNSLKLKLGFNKNQIPAQHAYYIKFNTTNTFGIFNIPKFGSRKAKKIQTMLMSTFLQQGAEDALKGLNDTDFVLCITYFDITTGQKIDTQLFLTGGVENYEVEQILNDDDTYTLRAPATVIGELNEEAHMKLSEEKIKFVSQYKNTNKSNFTFMYDTYSAKISDLAISDTNTHQSNRLEEKIPNMKYKITAVVTGTKNDVKHVVGQMPRLPIPSTIEELINKSNDNISGLTFISVYDARILINIINQKKEKKDNKPFWFSFVTHTEYVPTVINSDINSNSNCFNLIFNNNKNNKTIIPT
jgi:hypothetical protein